MKSGAVFLIGVSLHLAACSPPPDRMVYPVGQVRPPSAKYSDEEIKAKAGIWADCGFNKIREMDDGRSDASTVAIAVRSACRQYSLATAASDLEILIEAILKMRSQGNNRQQAGLTEADMKTPAWLAWRDCVANQLHAQDIRSGTARAAGTAVAVRCRSLFKWRPGQDVDIVTLAIEKIRGGGPGEPSFTVGPPQKQPLTDVRM